MKIYILRFLNLFFLKKQQDTQSQETDINKTKYFQKCKSWLTGSHISKKTQKTCFEIPVVCFLASAFL